MKGAFAIALLALAAGCTAQQLAENQQRWREAECDQAIDTPRREACLKEVRKNQ
jgi:hypothetical protein